jgi:peptidoglycan/LPS O-acetylase OafA/YrhL
MTIKYRHLPTLDGWRAVAITMVIVTHDRAPFFMRPGWVHDLAPYGRLGVDIFFAISGMLICSRLLDESAQSRIDLRAFYIRRVFRILPPYFFYLTVLAVFAALGAVTVPAEEFWVCLAFLRNYFATGPSNSVYTFHFWSLAVEEHFYLLWPAALKRLGARRSTLAALVTCLAIHVWRSLNARSPQLTSLFPYTGILWRTDTRLDALLWGCLAALCMDRLAPFFSRRSWTIPIAAFLVLAIWRHFPALPLIYSVGFAALVVSTVLNPTSLPSRLLELAPVRWVGRLSYSLYIWQTIFISVEHPTGWMSYVQGSPLNLGVALLFAAGSYYLLEKPIVALGRKVATPASTSPSPVA